MLDRFLTLAGLGVVTAHWRGQVVNPISMDALQRLRRTSVQRVIVMPSCQISEWLCRSLGTARVFVE